MGKLVSSLTAVTSGRLGSFTAVTSSSGKLGSLPELVISGKLDSLAEVLFGLNFFFGLALFLVAACLACAEAVLTEVLAEVVVEVDSVFCTLLPWERKGSR